MGKWPPNIEILLLIFQIFDRGNVDAEMEMTYLLVVTIPVTRASWDNSSIRRKAAIKLKP